MFAESDNWIAVGDSDNEWITFNTMNDRVCKTYTEVGGDKPEWGTQNQTINNNWDRAVKCCR